MVDSHQWSLSLRLVATLGAVVALFALFLGAFGFSLWRASTAVSEPSTTSSTVFLAVLFLAVAALVVVHARYGYRHSLTAVDAQPLTDDQHGLEARVRRLALAANVAEPTVAVVDSETPNSFTVGNGTEATLVVTTGLLETLSPSELEAVLAHEVAHLANRDATVATIVAAIATISETLFARERRLGQWIRFLLSLGSVTAILAIVAIPVLVLTVLFVFVSVFARLVLAANGLCLGLHAQTREYAADRVATELIGDPAPLVSALESLEATKRPQTDKRLHASATLGIVPHPFVAQQAATNPETAVSRWLPDESTQYDHGLLSAVVSLTAALSSLAARLGRALEWRPATHPPTPARIKRLRAMARDEA